MIVEAGGTVVKEGQLVQVMIGTQPIRGFVKDTKDGGIMLASSGGPPGKRPDTVFLIIEVPLLDAEPGQKHPVLIRLCNPETERIVSKEN